MSRKGISAFALFAAAAIAAAGAYAEGRRDSPAFGVSVGERAGDFSLGLEAASPTFLEGFLGLRAGAEVLWKEAVSRDETEAEWRPYSLYRLGVQATGADLKDIRLYGEFGGAALIPPEESIGETRFGIYGVWGFEFFIPDFQRLCYFIELGATGTFGAADEGAIGEPYLANGFSARAGLRVRI
jgi:hypothetical protein